MTNTISLEIRGMTCGHCERAVTKALQDVEGVSRVEVSLEKGEARVEASPDADPLKMVAAVEEEGYDAAVK